MTDKFPDKLIEHFSLTDRLDALPRSGYLLNGIRQPETIASHIFSVSYLTMLVGRYLKESGMALDLEKALQMALLHEDGEIFIGDLTLEAKRILGNDVKINAEKEAGGTFLSNIDEGLKEVFHEFLEKASNEAKLVADCDALQLLFKCNCYRLEGNQRIHEFMQPEKYSFFYSVCSDTAEKIFESMK